MCSSNIFLFNKIEVPRRNQLVVFVLFIAIFFLGGCTDSSTTATKELAAPAQHQTLVSPTDMVMDRRGNMYISEFTSGRIFCVSQNGTTTLLAEGLLGPAGLCLDRDGNLLVVENRTGRVVRIQPDGLIHIVTGE